MKSAAIASTPAPMPADRMRTNNRLERDVAALFGLPREALVARWIKTYGCPPPKGIKRGLLERSAAWHLQAKHLGSYSPAVRRSLREAEKPASKYGTDAPKEAAPIAPTSIRPGTRLMREWNGRMHVVDITGDGILFDGKLYRSLTAVVKRITGTHWSGPRFFGL